MELVEKLQVILTKIDIIAIEHNIGFLYYNW